MTAEERNGVVFVESVKDFDLDNIFDCGQCFRWEKTETGMYPVSYTHLDVYKRQPYTWTYMCKLYRT